MDYPPEFVIHSIASCKDKGEGLYVQFIKTRYLNQILYEEIIYKYHIQFNTIKQLDTILNQIFCTLHCEDNNISNILINLKGQIGLHEDLKLEGIVTQKIFHRDEFTKYLARDIINAINDLELICCHNSEHITEENIHKYFWIHYATRYMDFLKGYSKIEFFISQR